MTQFDSPPSEVIPDLPPEPPGWPKVVGIISIVWASLGLFCGGCGGLMAFVGPMMIPEAQRDQFPPNMSPGPALLAVIAVGMLSGVLLLVAGVMTLRRKPIGSTLHMVCAVISLLLIFPNIYFQLQQQTDLAKWASENPASQFAQQMNSPAQKMMQTGGLLFGVVIGAAYPVFLLIWFGLVKRGAAAYGPRDSRAMI